MLLNQQYTEVKKFHLCTVFTYHSDLTEKKKKQEDVKSQSEKKQIKGEIEVCICLGCYL